MQTQLKEIINTISEESVGVRPDYENPANGMSYITFRDGEVAVQFILIASLKEPMDITLGKRLIIMDTVDGGFASSAEIGNVCGIDFFGKLTFLRGNISAENSIYHKSVLFSKDFLRSIKDFHENLLGLLKEKTGADKIFYNDFSIDFRGVELN